LDFLEVGAFRTVWMALYEPFSTLPDATLVRFRVMAVARLHLRSGVWTSVPKNS
jgi:hypothetical protein